MGYGGPIGGISAIFTKYTQPATTSSSYKDSERQPLLPKSERESQQGFTLQYPATCAEVSFTACIGTIGLAFFSGAGFLYGFLYKSGETLFLRSATAEPFPNDSEWDNMISAGKIGAIVTAGSYFLLLGALYYKMKK